MGKGGKITLTRKTEFFNGLLDGGAFTKGLY